MSYTAKLAICIVIGVIGFGMVMARQSIPLLVIGFLLVAFAVASGYYFWARLRQPKNHMDPEISMLSTLGEQNLREQEKREKEK